MPSEQRNSITVASTPEPQGLWFVVARYCTTWFMLLATWTNCNLFQRTVVFGGEHLEAKPRRIFAFTHRALWDSFWLGGIIAIRNLWKVLFRQNLLPLNVPDGINFMDSPSLWLFFKLLRCVAVLRKNIVQRLRTEPLDEKAIEEEIARANAETRTYIVNHLAKGGTLLWFMTPGRDPGDDVNASGRTLGLIVLLLHKMGISVEVVPGYSVNHCQTFRKTRDDVPWPSHLVPEFLGLRKFAKMVVWIFAQRPFRYRDSECLVANAGPPLTTEQLLAMAGDGSIKERAQRITNAVAEAIRALKPRVDEFRGVADNVPSVVDVTSQTA